MSYGWDYDLFSFFVRLSTHKLTVYFNSSRFVSLIILKLLKYFPYVVYGEVDSMFKCHYF
jgi:hypothetical protein